MVAIRYLNDDDKSEFCHIPMKRRADNKRQNGHDAYPHYRNVRAYSDSF